MGDAARLLLASARERFSVAATDLLLPERSRLTEWQRLTASALLLRLVRAVRFLRTGRVLSSAVRSSRSARSVLGGRIGWLAAVSAITVLVADSPIEDELVWTMRNVGIDPEKSNPATA